MPPLATFTAALLCLLAVDMLSVIRSGAAGAMPPLATFTVALLACWRSIYSALFATGQQVRCAYSLPLLQHYWACWRSTAGRDGCANHFNNPRRHDPLLNHEEQVDIGHSACGVTPAAHSTIIVRVVNKARGVKAEASKPRPQTQGQGQRHAWPRPVSRGQGQQANAKAKATNSRPRPDNPNARAKAFGLKANAKDLASREIIWLREICWLSACVQ